MFSNRLDAGKKLSEKITKYNDCLVLAIPRGGVVVGDVIAQKLNCPLDVVVSKKVTPVNYPEYAIGAITPDGTLYKTHYWDKFSNDPNFSDELHKKQIEVTRRLRTYRKDDLYSLEGKTVIIVDDGIATGSTTLAILNWIQKQKCKKIVLAIPVIPFDTVNKLKKLVDEIISLHVPHDFSSVGEFYDDFKQVTDSKVKTILKKYHC